jgi:hypothetical protein
MMVAPVLVVFLLFQRWSVRGGSSTGWGDRKGGGWLPSKSRRC